MDSILDGGVNLVAVQLKLNACEHGDDTANENGLSVQKAKRSALRHAMQLISHSSTERIAWDLFLAVLTVLVVLFIPVKMGFDWKLNGSPLIVERTIDYIFLFDVCLNFRTSYEDEGGSWVGWHARPICLRILRLNKRTPIQFATPPPRNPSSVKLPNPDLIMTPLQDTNEEVTNSRKIAMRYLKGWFWIDLISSIPFPESDEIDPNMAKSLKFVRVLRILKLARVVRLMRLDLDFLTQYINPFVLRLYKLLLIFFVVQHFLACIYWKVSIETCSALKGKCPEELYDDAHGQNLDDLFTGTGEYGLEQFACGWEHCQFSPPPVFEPKDESDMVATWDRYLVAITWSILAAQGGITLEQPTHMLQTFTVMCTMVVGLLVDAVLIGSIAQVLADQNAKQRAKSDFLERVNAAMLSHGVPKSLKTVIRDYNKYLWDNGYGQDQQEDEVLFSNLPSEIRRQYELVKKRKMIRDMPIIQAIQGSTNKAIFVDALELAIHMPGERIIKQGEIGNEMYFLIRGKCTAYDENESSAMYLRTMLAGSFFGEIALLNSPSLPDSYQLGATVVVVKPGKKGADGQETKSRCYGETALVKDDNWNGMCKVEITSGPCAGEIKSYQTYHLRPEGHTINSEQETGGLRTATVMSNSFAELQVLKKADWDRLIQLSPSIHEIFENVRHARARLSKNSKKLHKVGENHRSVLHRGSIQLEALNEEVLNAAPSVRRNVVIERRQAIRAAVDLTIAGAEAAKKRGQRLRWVVGWWWGC
mmetsp:Transcript_67822/g.187416  ORF Transcript_67822/g.187416 Transcript_67822/m.187416 type:complete len:760 (-) Transcript_67822:602-2881(-)